jgi:DNA/RNA-binding domain of Phe-tRNA-synthetase-like protein
MRPCGDASVSRAATSEATVPFTYAPSVRTEFPELVTGLLEVDGITKQADVTASMARFCDVANARLGSGMESALPEIQAWRRTFGKMGLKPTQYRCASEALLRRFRTERALPRLHPLVDLCNAVSIAFAIPIAAFDRDKLAGMLQVRHATGDETYEAFSGEIEHPDAGEVIFADEQGRAHARRWTNRQSGYSAVRDETARVLIVAEAMHDGAADDMRRLVTAVSAGVREVWPGATLDDRSGDVARWERQSLVVGELPDDVGAAIEAAKYGVEPE